MEETKEQKSLYRLLQFAIYLSVLLEIYIFILADKLIITQYTFVYNLTNKISNLPFYSSLSASKFCTLLLIGLVSIGTLSKKKIDFNPTKYILYPLLLATMLISLSIWAYYKEDFPLYYGLNLFEYTYAVSSFIGTILLHIALDNISKIINTSLGKDRWNVEQESFEQPTKAILGQYAINIPMLFYYKRKVYRGFINLENLFRGLLVCGVPGSGKSFGIIMPIIRQMIAKSFTMCLYDLKYPDLGKIAYYHYSIMSKKNNYQYSFHVINLNDPQKSRRINPFRSDYIKTLADASETAEALVEALKKGDKSAGSDQFFTQSAINFLAACIYFFSKYENGKYSTLPHVLAFLNLSYDQIFDVLFSNKELASLLSPFMSAYKAKAFDQLEGQVGTLKIFISRMATKETFWVFAGDDFDLRISSKESPAILVLANDPSTQSINSACLSIVLNRVTKLINTKGNLPVGLVVDEAPSVYIHRVEVLLAQARSNLSAVVLGLQELPMLRQQYGKETADTIISIMGNIISGAVRSKDTLEWLERLFGKVKQKGESLSIDRTKTSISMNEKLDALIPAGKISSLSSGEVVGILARDRMEKFTGKFNTTAINCRINLNISDLQKEEKNYQEMPQFYDFGNNQDLILLQNFSKIIEQVNDLVNQIITE